MILVTTGQVERTVFDRAGKDLKLQFLLLQSSQCSEYDVDKIEVITCQSAIQCIEADAMIIAVKSDLHMNQSGVGSILQSIGECVANSRHLYTAQVQASC